MKNEYELYLENRNHLKTETKPKLNRFRAGLIIAIVMVVIVVGTVGANMYSQVYGYTTNTKFTTADVQNRLFKIFNEDRSDFGVSTATLDIEMSNRSYYRAMDVRDYGVGEDTYYTKEDIFIVKKEAFGRSYYNSPREFVDVWRNTDIRFRANELDRDNERIGIGVVEGNEHFYIVVRWE